MKKRYVVVSAIALLLVALFALAAFATQAELYFSADKNGQTRVTNVHEGQQVWICVYDPSQNINCDLRDKMWVDLKLFDPKTGAYIVWKSYGPVNADGTHATNYGLHYVGHHGDTSNGNFLEETGADTGLFVSNTPFRIGTRQDYSNPMLNTHIVGQLDSTGNPLTFKWGNYMYLTDGSGNAAQSKRGWFGHSGTGVNPGFVVPSGSTNIVPPSTDTAAYPAGSTGTPNSLTENEYLIGRFENGDTLVGMFQDPTDPTSVAIGMMKIVRTEAKISWDKTVYKDYHGAATITITAPNENLDASKVEYVPVFIIVNPGSWNPVQTHSANSFCMLKAYGGVDPALQTASSNVLNRPIRWYNIYNSGLGSAAANAVNNSQPKSDGAYYIQYPTSGNVTSFNTADSNGYCRVMFYAQETGPNTGVFQLNINNIATDLGFKTLKVRDVLAAYYLDPNDSSNFHIATAYIGEQIGSVTSFTDSTRTPKTLYWLGRDSVYTQVIDSNANVDSCCPEQVVIHICDPHGADDSEYVIADETSSNSPVFFTFAGIQLLPVWDALGSATPGLGGYQLQLNNWKIEAFNGDTVYARYNDVVYTPASLAKLGNGTASDIPPTISTARVANDVSFAQMKVGSTDVYNGSKVTMYFRDRQGNRVSGYVSSDCVFVEVVDPDQNEDSYRRERIAANWDGGQNYPFGPMNLRPWTPGGGVTGSTNHPVNNLLGLTNIFGSSTVSYSAPKLYVLNPRNGRWAAVDLLETGAATGDFVSVTCIDLASQYTGVPTLGAKPGDTIIAVYQDPSNHHDSAWISIKVGIGGGTVPPSQMPSITFADAQGTPVTQYTDKDNVYVKVTDPSHSTDTQLLDAVAIGTKTFSLHKLAGTTDSFITDAISMSTIGATAGSTITAKYTDPTNQVRTATATANVIASTLSITKFYVDPNPFSTTTTFSYEGSGTATTFAVSVYDLAGHLVWHKEAANVSKITWDGTVNGVKLMSGPYVYVAVLTGPAAGGTTKTFTYKGTLGIQW